MKKIFRRVAAALLLTAVFGTAGCMKEAPKKMLSEDIDTLTVFAPEIAILQSDRYPPNSQEKYQAAKRLAEGVDFSLTRNTGTVRKMFRPEDGVVTHTDEYGDEMVFYYPYQNGYVRIRFWFAKNLVTDSEVRIR